MEEQNKNIKYIKNSNNQNDLSSSNQINKINQINKQITYKKDILRVLISIYYYEKILSNLKKDNIFKDEIKYYLINSNG